MSRPSRPDDASGDAPDPPAQSERPSPVDARGEVAPDAPPRGGLRVIETPAPPLSQRAQALVDGLVKGFREQLRRSLGVELDDSETSLAFVDHHLRTAADEDPFIVRPGRDREPILLLVAAGAGAYYGELVRRKVGGFWIGDGEDPRRLRLLLAPQFLYFSPVDQAFEAIVARPLEPGDPESPRGNPIDSAFHLQPPPEDDPEGEQHDANWLMARLAELHPVPEDHFHSLTCRFETLELMLELLAAKHVSEGRGPSALGIDDYLVVLGR